MLYNKNSLQTSNERLLQHSQVRVWQMTANMIHDSAKLKENCSSKIRNETRMPLYLIPFKIALGIAGYKKYVKNEMKDI